MTNSDKFNFTPENQQKAAKIIANYPKNRQKSAILPLLDLAQRQNNGYLSPASLQHVADLVGEDYLRLYEVASFYSMFNLKPVGKYHLQVCGTTPCWLRGATLIKEQAEKETGSKNAQISADGLFSVSEVECLGACINAPIVQINDDYYENLDASKLTEIIADLKEKAK